MLDLIRIVNMMRDVPRSEFRSSIQKVGVILCNPRSGSSLLKDILATHPDIATLDGEMDPFITLSGNGFGFNSGSDAIGTLSNCDALADNIFDDLSVPSGQRMSTEWLRKKWIKRLLIQFPSLLSDKNEHDDIAKLLDEALQEIDEKCIQDEGEITAHVLSKVFSNEPWRLNFYDGRCRTGVDVSFHESLKIEEPPFVVPRCYRRPFSACDIESKVLLFKAPPDAYRIGMYEQIFPNADIRYFHLTRGYAQSVNGLMDGWLSPVGFFSHDLRQAGLALDIEGYSDFVDFGKRWWKFDLPPNWKAFVNANLVDVCLNQWLSTHEAILESGVDVLRISFEDFLKTPKTVINKITEHLGVSALDFPSTLPVCMATETPKLMRWKKRSSVLLSLGERKSVKSMMALLGYEMRPEAWL